MFLAQSENKFFERVLLLCALLSTAAVGIKGQSVYRRPLSEARIQELHSLALRLQHAINPDKYACESFYDYVCSRNKALFSISGHMPETSELMQLMADLQNDAESFDAKQKLMDFFVSCNQLKTLDDCYRESFEFFKPLFGHISAKNYVDVGSLELLSFNEMLRLFIKNTEVPELFARHPVRLKLMSLKSKYRIPYDYFRPAILDTEYAAVPIYPTSYEHNVRHLQLYRRRNSTFEMGLQRTVLDWTLYLYQSRSKPMSYYFSTYGVHLWMALYNTTERMHEPKYFTDAMDCLKLPQFFSVLDEARVLALVYLKSFRSAWNDYHQWMTSPTVNMETYEQEREILRRYQLSNEQVFFTLYAQNFCDFGKELAESLFYIGLKERPEFSLLYGCAKDSYFTDKMCV